MRKTIDFGRIQALAVRFAFGLGLISSSTAFMMYPLAAVAGDASLCGYTAAQVPAATVVGTARGPGGHLKLPDGADVIISQHGIYASDEGISRAYAITSNPRGKQPADEQVWHLHHATADIPLDQFNRALDTLAATPRLSRLALFDSAHDANLAIFNRYWSDPITGAAILVASAMPQRGGKHLPQGSTAIAHAQFGNPPTYTDAVQAYWIVRPDGRWPAIHDPSPALKDGNFYYDFFGIGPPWDYKVRVYRTDAGAPITGTYFGPDGRRALDATNQIGRGKKNDNPGQILIGAKGNRIAPGRRVALHRRSRRQALHDLPRARQFRLGSPQRHRPAAGV